LLRVARLLLSERSDWRRKRLAAILGERLAGKKNRLLGGGGVGGSGITRTLRAAIVKTALRASAIVVTALVIAAGLTTA
jgi:hypothetical protein